MQTRMIAEIAYNAYAKVTDNKNFRGDEMPLFQDLGEKIQNAWIAAVSAVRMPRLADLEDQPLAEALDRLSLALGIPELTIEAGELIEVALIDRAIEKLAEKNGTVAA